MTLNIKVEELDLAAEAGQSEEPVEVSAPDAPVETGIGVSVEPITPTVMRQLRVPEGRGGAVMAEVSPRSSALGALTSGDVILGINGTPVSSVNDVKTRLERASTGTLIRVLVWRRALNKWRCFERDKTVAQFFFMRCAGRVNRSAHFFCPRPVIYAWLFTICYFQGEITLPTNAQPSTNHCFNRWAGHTLGSDHTCRGQGSSADGGQEPG